MSLPEDQLAELLEFLVHPRADVQAEALRTVVGFVEHPDFLGFARAHAKAVVRPLLRVAEGDDAAVRIDALPALVNLAADEVLLETFVACAAAKRTVAVLGAGREFTLQLQLLANVTRRKAAAAEAVVIVERLIELLTSTGDDPAVDAAAKVLENCCVLRSVRDTMPLDSLCKLLPSKRRRLPALRLLLQLAADPAQHQRLGEAEQGTLAARLGTFLYPTAAKTDPEYANRREDLDPLILAGAGLTEEPEERSAAAVLLLRLGGTPTGRAGLQEAGIYEVVRAWHLVETDAQVKENLEDLAPLVQYSEQELADYGILPKEEAVEPGPSAEEQELLRAAREPFEDEDNPISAELDTVD